jgi:hypothetical protein
LQQSDLALTSRVFDIPHQVAESKNMQLHTKLQSALQCIMELERQLDAMHDNRFLCHEHIQLGLEIFVADKHGVSASMFPFMMVLALIVMIIPGTYKYYTLSV